MATASRRNTSAASVNPYTLLLVAIGAASSFDI